MFKYREGIFKPRIYTIHYKDGTSWTGNTQTQIPYHLINKSLIIHRLDGPAIEGLCESWYIDGEFIYCDYCAFEKILKIQSKEDLINYLLDDSKHIRQVANYRLEVLEKQEIP